MKRTLAILVLTVALSLAGRAAEDYYTGAWFDAKAPTPGQRQAGQIDVQLEPDHTVMVNIYYDGKLVAQSASGSWLVKGAKVLVAFTDTDGWVWKGTLARELFTGGYQSPGRAIVGKWQAN